MCQRGGGGTQKECRHSALRTRPEWHTLTFGLIPLTGTSSCGHAKIQGRMGNVNPSWAAIHSQNSVNKENKENGCEKQLSVYHQLDMHFCVKFLFSVYKKTHN